MRTIAVRACLGSTTLLFMFILPTVTVTSFKYLGSVITDEGSKLEIPSRIAQATAALTRLKQVWIDKSISPNSKIRLMRSLVTSIFLYACESWTHTAELQRRIQSMEMRCYRKIVRISYKDHVTNEEVRAKIQQAIRPHEDLLTIVKRRKLQWYGHVFRSSGLAKTILQGTVKGWRRQGGQRKRWEDNIREWTGLEFCKSQSAVETREKWRNLVAKSSVVPQQPSRLMDWWWWRWSFPHCWHFAGVLQSWLVWTNLLQLKHRSGFWTNRSTFTFKYPTLISFGMSYRLKVRNRVLVGLTFPSFFTVTRWSSTTPCVLSSSLISTSDKSESSRQLITPREEFKLLCTETCTGRLTNVTVFNRFSALGLLEHPTRKDPSLSLLVLLRVPAIAWKPFCTVKGDSLLRGFSSLADVRTTNMGQLSFLRKVCYLSLSPSHHLPTN